MFSHKFLNDPVELNGKKYLNKYLFKKIHPAYSGILMDYEKVYVSFRDAETNKLYLIDDQGKVCKGFPITGYNSTKDISTSNLEFVFKSGNNSFSLYKVE